MSLNLPLVELLFVSLLIKVHVFCVVHMCSFMCPAQWIPHNNQQKPRSACPICLSTWRPVKHLATPPFNSRSGRSRKPTRSQSQAEPRHPRNDECPQMPVCVVVISLGYGGLVVSWVVVSGACWTSSSLAVAVDGCGIASNVAIAA